MARRHGYRNGVVLQYSFGGNVLMMSERSCCDWSMELREVLGDRPRNFEPRSSDEDDTWADTPSPDFHTTPTGRHWSLNTFIVHRPLLYSGSSAVLDLNS
ncbi:hypothetical protein TNCV_306681 [Trichonephila clavipes]|nr:hypothetical protein TNCV_306681 [Trichonephila clavipes]